MQNPDNTENINHKKNQCRKFNNFGSWIIMSDFIFKDAPDVLILKALFSGIIFFYRYMSSAWNTA